jgi:hypothetical protein
MTDAMPPESDGHANGREPDLNTLAAFVDRRLDPSARDRVVLHLAECARCRAIVAELMNADATRRTESRLITRALPLAATFLIAAAGGGLYFALRDHAPAAPQSVAAPRATPSAAAAPAPSTSSQPSTPANANAQSPVIKPPVSAPARRPQSDRTRAVGTKSVGRKTFRLVAGEWIDTGYRRTDLLPVVDIQSRSEFDAHPDLHRFATLGSRFTVVIGGVVYRVQLPPPAK